MDTACSGAVVVEYSSKEPPVDCEPFVCTVQDEACDALGDLYYATNGSGWIRQKGWLEAAAGQAVDYCGFDGLGCDDSGLPTSLFLTLNALNGTIPDSIGHLTALTYLGLDGNALRGSVPESVTISRISRTYGCWF